MYMYPFISMKQILILTFALLTILTGLFFFTIPAEASSEEVIDCPIFISHEYAMIGSGVGSEAPCRGMWTNDRYDLNAVATLSNNYTLTSQNYLVGLRLNGLPVANGHTEIITCWDKQAKKPVKCKVTVKTDARLGDYPKSWGTKDPTAAPKGFVFKDVANTFWAGKDIQWAVENKLLFGYTDGYFRPNQALTEAHFATVLARYYKITVRDRVKGETIYDPLYKALAQKGIKLKGTSSVADRTKPITRVALAQALHFTQGGSGDARQAVQWLYDHNISSGTTGSKTFDDYRPYGNLTRSHISAFFLRMDAAGLTKLN